MVAPSRSMSTAWPRIRPSAGAASAVVTPAMRVIGINVEAGLMPSATLNDAATVSFRTAASFVSRTAPISVSPI